MAMNRGEWSEFYAILSLLSDSKIKIADEKLDVINDNLYTIKRLTIEEQDNIINYVINNDSKVEVYFNDNLKEKLETDDIEKEKKVLFQNIVNAVAGGGAFEIPNVQSLLSKMTPTGIIKSKSSSKKDLKTVMYDSRLGNEADLSYSIKSCLGSPATLLNASNQTNFVYEVTNLNPRYISEINSIDTRTKLVDRINRIKSLGGTIKFEKVECENFDYNLRMIDSNLPKYLGDVLLNSYTYDNKNLKELFLNNSNFSDDTFALKKLGDFLSGISFGFFPSVKWNGINDVNGGLIIVKKDGNVVILDLIYFKEKVLSYLINETKLDSPSSSRYHMLELYEKNGKIYFTLNLQVRYKN